MPFRLAIHNLENLFRWAKVLNLDTTAAPKPVLEDVKRLGALPGVRVHEAVHPPAPDPCSVRQPDGRCKRILNASIEQDVLSFVFPGSAFGSELNAGNLESKVKERAFALYNRLRGVT